MTRPSPDEQKVPIPLDTIIRYAGRDHYVAGVCYREAERYYWLVDVQDEHSVAMVPAFMLEAPEDRGPHPLDGFTPNLQR